MTESNPPAQPKELRRRILFLLQEKDRQGDYSYLSHIATDFGETPKEIRDQLEILESEGLAIEAMNPSHTYLSAEIHRQGRDRICGNATAFGSIIIGQFAQA